jgi:glutamate synthase (NADPH/NADH) large chain
MDKENLAIVSASQEVRQWTAASQPDSWLDEHDACAIVAAIRKSGEATHGNLKRTMDALSKMGHRSGSVNGEGDGCGLLTDIPRRLWAEALEEEGKPGWLSEDRRFFVGHFMIPASMKDQTGEIRSRIKDMIFDSGADLLLEREGLTRPTSLGRMARSQAPFFWQIAGFMGSCPLPAVEHCLFDLTLAIERGTGVHVASLSSHSVVYKVRGSIETLYQYYPELRSPNYMTAITLGHARYSTNTTTAFERVQPFSLLGHNGEINTIARLREQALMLGVQLVENGSDSQDADRTVAALIHRYGFTLGEAMELLFPPILSEVDRLEPELQRVYRYYRQAFGPYAQGPAAMIARYEDECVFSVDALGLRPLWFGETEKEYFFSSEKGVYHLDLLCSEPRALSPGEKMCVRLRRNDCVEVLDYPAMQQRLLHLSRHHIGQGSSPSGLNVSISEEGKGQAADGSQGQLVEPVQPAPPSRRQGEQWLAAMGWSREDREWVQSLAESGHEPIGSMGYDGPLAALSSERQNIADYFKEAVAVVTNPAIDQEREKEHFSTQVVIGPRPALTPQAHPTSKAVILDCPILLGGHKGPTPVSKSIVRQVAGECQTSRLEDLIEAFPTGAVVTLAAVTQEGETIPQALGRLAGIACQAVDAGARLIVLDDRMAFSGRNGWIDPLLVVPSVDRALRAGFKQSKEPDEPLPLPVDSRGRIDLSSLFAEHQVNLRRQAGLVLCSGAIRSLHDLIMSLGLGADAVAPYSLLETAIDYAKFHSEPAVRASRLRNTVRALTAGLEKVISTMGVHELRGYGRLFAGIGLSQPLAEAIGAANFAGSQERGLTWDNLETDMAERARIVNGEARPQLSREHHFYPKLWKIAGQVARGEASSSAFEEAAEAVAKDLPVTLRHILGFHFPESSEKTISPQTVDAGLTGHNLPFVIASMSFGSQGESAFRAYAQAAYWLNIIALNGEGGEIQDMMGKFPHNRGQQIASGRFGVSADLINSSNLLEIKIGQGAKPGEGGHLPGRKVTEKIAATRHANPGADLISPSNNHDIYSIEDLAQFIEELKTANPKARVAVKVPVVPGIGIISVGIAKAGADIINLTGYDGGTGAARQHSIKHVGLPAEIGVVAAHRALSEAGLRASVELWCDGGMRTAADVVKMICLGANRVGFGSLAMVAAGCTICRACQKGTCHVGITTQIETQEQAEELGLRRFVPCDFEEAVSGLMKLFGGLGDEVRGLTARLGFQRTQDLVGRSDLLEQVSFLDRVDLSDLLLPAGVYMESRSVARQLALANGNGYGTLRRPRNHLTTVISDLVMETVAVGDREICFEDDKVSPVDRALGTHLTGALTRYQRHWDWPPGHGGVGGKQETWRPPLNGNGRNGNGNGNGKAVRDATLRFYASSVPGNGLGAFNSYPVNIIVEGGAQDGVAKGMQGGRVVILKGYNHDGELIDGSVGKSLAYGATGGMVIVQGDADSRACIRLSGADVIIGGNIHLPLNDSLGFIGARANVKGFLCEYMTSGRVLVLGDPGPWICAGMTGGVLYLRLQPRLNFDRAAIQRRIARGASVALSSMDDADEPNLGYLLRQYADELGRNHQIDEAQRMLSLLVDWRTSFVKILANCRQMDQTVATE